MGFKAIDIEIGNNLFLFNLKKGFIGLELEQPPDFRILNNFRKGFVGLSVEVDPIMTVQNLVTPIEIN